MAISPSIDSVFPPGAQRGKTVTVTASGIFGQWPIKVWTDGPGIEIRALPERGKLAIEVASDARVGVHRFRLFDEEGATAPWPFLVGTLPEVVEVEPNDDPTGPQRLDGSGVTIDLERSRFDFRVHQPQQLDAPGVTVNGKLDRKGDVDGFAIPLRKGQTLVAALEANRRLGAPMDGVLQVASADGFVLDQNDDAPDRDPRIVFEAPADGTYLVRAFAFPAVPDSRIGFAGGNSFVYRLTLTTGGYLDHLYPLAVPRESIGRVEAVGWNIPESARFLDVVAVDDDDDATGGGRGAIVDVDHRLLANAGEVRREPHPTPVEVEPNPPEHPQDVTLPATISGRIDPPRDRDAYRVVARKGEKWLIKVESRGLGHPLDAVLLVLDDSNKVLDEVDDPGRGRGTARDPDLLFTAPDDGAYRVVVRDLDGDGSFRHAYRMTLTRPTPDFALTLAAERFTVTPGTPLKFPLTVARDNDFGGTVEVVVDGLPEGVQAPRISSLPTGPSAKTLTMELTASHGPWSGPVRIHGRANAPEGEAKSRTARALIVGFNASCEHIWLTVLKPSPPPKDASHEKKEAPGGPKPCD